MTLAIIFPVDISFEASGGPEYSTDVAVTDGAWEQRNQNWPDSRLEWEVSFAARITNKEGELLAYFHMARGKFHDFLFKDWSDYKVPDNSGTGAFTTIDATHFQCVKHYGSGADAVDRTIKRLKSISVTGGVVASTDMNTGIVTMTSGTPTSWAGEFYVLCRFDTDKMKRVILDKQGRNLIMGWDRVPVVEVRE